jgi:hypothetical protein
MPYEDTIRSNDLPEQWPEDGVVSPDGAMLSELSVLTVV